MRINSGKMRIKSHPVRAHNPVGQLPTAYYTVEGVPRQLAATQCLKLTMILIIGMDLINTQLQT